MKQQNNQVDQKKGSADCDVTGSKKGMPGGEIGRNSVGSTQNAASYGGYESSYGNSGTSGSRSQPASTTVTGKSDNGGPEGNSRERKSARSGSDSSES